VRRSSPAARARIAASIIGVKKHSDFPEPVPVVTEIGMLVRIPTMSAGHSD
jgi:hypothetical protein